MTSINNLEEYIKVLRYRDQDLGNQLLELIRERGEVAYLIVQTQEQINKQLKESNV